jgi:heptosyltransferase II
VNRTLVIAPQWIGDAVMAEPLLATLAEGGDRVTVAALPWVAPVFSAMPEVAEIVELPFAHGRLDWAARRRVAAQWRDRFDVAYVLPNSLKSALVPWLARIPERVGYAAEGRSPLLSRRLAAPEGRPPMVAFYGALAGAGFDKTRHPRLRLATAVLDETTTRHDLRPGRYWAFAPGAEYGPAKRWPPNQFAELAAMLLRDGLQVWIVGSPNDKMAADAVLNSLGENLHKVRDLTGRTDLGTAIDILSAASLVVSNDSGLMHAAAAVGVPLVALFGSSSPTYTPPLSPTAQIAKIDIVCSPCFKRECPLGHFKCMRELKPPIVYNLARTALPAYIPPELRR